KAPAAGPEAGAPALGVRAAARGRRPGAVCAAGVPERPGGPEVTAAGTWAYFWWVIRPYSAMAVCVRGHVWRWRYDRFGWTSYSTQLQEKGWLKWGAPLFHYGTFAAIAGHVMGILVPKAWTDALGISQHAYHLFSASAGLLAAVLVIIGMVILAARRLFVPRVKSTTSPVDWVALVLLGIMVVLGIAVTAVNAPLG